MVKLTRNGPRSSGFVHQFDSCVGKCSRIVPNAIRAPVPELPTISNFQARVSEEEIREGSLSLIASYDGEAEEVGFTITAFSTIPSLSWDETPTKLPFSHKVRIALSPPVANLNPMVLETDVWHRLSQPQTRLMERSPVRTPVGTIPTRPT